ncbi:MAG: type II pantothenate kinase [Sporolactobacillus sp.]
MQALQQIGIDAGGTLIKLAMSTVDGLQFHYFQSSELNECAQWLAAHFPNARLAMTGGRAERLAAQIKGTRPLLIPEFEASLKGAYVLINRSPSATLNDYVLVNVGTGTSLFAVHRDKSERLGGSGVGGGTLLGLSALLIGSHSFDAIIQLGQAGARDRVDQSVASIYEGKEPPIPGDLTASNFGHAVWNKAVSSADKAAAIIGLVAETVCTMAILAAQKERVEDIVYIGSTFSGNRPMRRIIESYCQFNGMRPHFFDEGGFCGAIGALCTLDVK